MTLKVLFSIWEIDGLGFKSLEDAKDFQKYCNEHPEQYGFVDDSDIKRIDIVKLIRE